MDQTIIRSRIDSAIKEEASRLLGKMGLTMSDAIRLFLHRVIVDKGLPFEVKAPNEVTAAAVRAVERGELERTSLKGIAHDWEAACAKSSRRRSSRKT
jgi:DNA-damage-inducible protein J